MIFGIGIDIVENKRILEAYRRWGERFLERVFSPAELKFILQRPDPIPSMAIRFAAKEAFSKALKTGLRKGIYLKDIAMLHHPSGEPFLQLSGRAKELTFEIGIRGIHVSASHERSFSVAIVILEV